MNEHSPSRFLSDESGAVTVDWVVLTAALVGLGLAVMAVISTGLEDLSGDVGEALERDDIIKTSFTVASAAFDQDEYDKILTLALTGVLDGTTNPIPDEFYVRTTFEQNVLSAQEAIEAGNRENAEYYIDAAAAWADGAAQREIEIIGGDEAMSGLRTGYDSATFSDS